MIDSWRCRMVKILNPSRLTKIIEFGYESDEPEYDQNDNPISSLSIVWKTTAIPWSLTTSQMIQAQGLNLTNQRVFAVRHRDDNFWSKISKAKYYGKTYEVTNINPAPTNSPTSYDLVTLKEASKHE